MIHSCLQRQWYVEKHLLPSMLEQGIDPHNIIVWEDIENIGCLRSFISSIKFLVESDEIGMWHLQDDIILSPFFKLITERIPLGDIVCGFCPSINEDDSYGRVDVEKMWYSFPCIFIPSFVAEDFYDWYLNDAEKDPMCKHWISENKFDDSLFHRFLEQYEYRIPIFNVKPNIVDHVDFLIGGSIVNHIRSFDMRAKYWYHNDLVKELEEKINANK